MMVHIGIHCPCFYLFHTFLIVISQINYSHFVTRQMTSDMTTIAGGIKSFLLKNCQGQSFAIKDLIHMVFIAYYDKKGIKKNVNQLPYHRDQRYNVKGEFMHSVNSQERNTSTCILTIGDTRTLNFQCFRNNDRKDGTGPIQIVNKEHSSKQFILKHGSLFVLHPKDEETVLRKYFNTTKSCFFKHGKVMFGRNGLSIGLAFRTTVHCTEVDAETGQKVMLDEKAVNDKFKENIIALDKYLADTFRKDRNDKTLQLLYLQLKRKYFRDPGLPKKHNSCHC